jgi:GntR family transcriptional regulator
LEPLLIRRHDQETGANMTETPAYERVATVLRAAILDCQITGRLPSLDTLAAQHDASREVVRRAIGILRGEGLVVTQQGRGTYVRTFQRIVRRSPSRLSGRRWRSGQKIQDADTGTRPRTADVIVGEAPAPPFAAQALGVAEDEPVLFRSRRFLVERRPVQLATSYLPLDLVGGTRVAYTDTGPGGIYARLAELGHTPTRFTEHLTARAPRPDEVERLELATAVGALVFQITRYAYTAAGRCVEVNGMVLDATAYELIYDFRA